MKTTFDFNFDFSQILNSMNPRKMETKRSCQLKKSFSLITCELIIRKNKTNNKNWNKKVVFILILSRTTVVYFITVRHHIPNNAIFFCYAISLSLMTLHPSWVFWSLIIVHDPSRLFIIPHDSSWFFIIPHNSPLFLIFYHDSSLIVMISWLVMIIHDLSWPLLFNVIIPHEFS